MLNRRADKQELLRIAEAVALEKSIDKELIIDSMETGIAKAAKSKFGHDNEIKVQIDRDNGNIEIFRKLIVVEKPENLNTEISLKHAQNLNVRELKKPVAYVTQTTLSVDDTKDIIEVIKGKFPEIKSPTKEDICYATTNRQEAVKKIAPLCDMFFVVGSKNSSNSQRLVEVAKKSGCVSSELITFNEKLPIDSIMKCNKIGITSGASAPEKLVQNLIFEIKKHCNVSMEEVVLTKENVTFKLPKALN